MIVYFFSILVRNANESSFYCALRENEKDALGGKKIGLLYSVPLRVDNGNDC